MPKSNRPGIDLSEYKKDFGPKLTQAWQTAPYNNSNMWNFFAFFVGQRQNAIADHGNDKKYFEILEKIWSTFSYKEINTPFYYDQTLLMTALELTQDPEVLSFIIERTDSKGINACCEGEVYSEKYALLTVINYGIRKCLEPLIDKSNTSILKAAKHAFEIEKRLKVVFKDKPQAWSIYSDSEIDFYISKIEERSPTSRWATVPFIGLALQKAFGGISAKSTTSQPPVTSRSIGQAAPKAASQPPVTVVASGPSAIPCSP